LTRTTRVAPEPAIPEEIEKSASESKSPSVRQRSRSSSKGKRRYKRRREDDSSEERKAQKKKEKKKHSQEKAKFSSESEGEAEEEPQGGRFSDEEPGQAKLGDSSSPVVKRPGQKSGASGVNESWAPAVSNTSSKPSTGNWLDINYLKGKIRIFASDIKKNENQGWSVPCHLYTSEPEEVVCQFPDFTKVVTFVFDKYMKDAEEIELQYQRKLGHMKRNPIPPSSQTIMAGWIVPAEGQTEGEGKSKEMHKLGYLESYLSKKPVSISYNPSAGLTVWVVMGKWLKNETLKAIGVKDKYDSDKTIKLDKQLIFFLRRNIEKEDKDAKKLTSKIVQQFDKQKESTLKYVFGQRAENGHEDKGKAQKGQSEQATVKDITGSKNADHLDPSIKEMLVLLRELSPQEAKEFFDSLDKNLKTKLRGIIQDHLPELLPTIAEQPPVETLPRPAPVPVHQVAPIQHPFYPHHPGPMMAPPIKPMQGQPGPGFMGPMGYDPTKMMQPGTMPPPGMHGPPPMVPGGPMYRPPPNMPMNPFISKPGQPMAMPFRPNPGVGVPPGVMGVSNPNLPNPTMTPPASLGYNPLSGTGHPPSAGNPQPPMMFPGMMPPMGPPGSYPMMGMPYMYPMPPGQMKPHHMMPPPTANPDSDKISNVPQPPK
jgi:hypothetical protein